VLAEAGLLNGRQAAVGSEFSSEFERAYPAVRANPRRDFIHDRGLWTASNAVSGIKVCLAMIEEHWGPGVRDAIALLQPVDLGNFQDSIPLELRVGPPQLADQLRAERARQEVQNGGEPFEAVARATGFRNAEDMRRGFVRFFGRPPQALRRAARMAREARNRDRNHFTAGKKLVPVFGETSTDD
jgi:transcriptional regulator GlxA family with amidase domain